MSSTTDPTPEIPDRDFIRRGVELADLNAVRVALYQHTHDPEIAALPMAMQLDDAGRALLIEKAVDWLRGQRRARACPRSPRSPSCGPS